MNRKEIIDKYGKEDIDKITTILMGCEEIDNKGVVQYQERDVEWAIRILKGEIKAPELDVE